MYTSLRHTWTASLDGFALLRIGKAIEDDTLPLVLMTDSKEVNSLNSTEGWIGDENEGNELDSRMLELGGGGFATPKARYRTTRGAEPLSGAGASI